MNNDEGTAVIRDLTKDAKPEIRYLCHECDELNDEPGEALHECGACDITFTRSNSANGGSNRCPDCNRFSSKKADTSCASCEEGEVEEVTVYHCGMCGEDVLEGEAAAHQCEEPDPGSGITLDE